MPSAPDSSARASARTWARVACLPFLGGMMTLLSACVQIEGPNYVAANLRELEGINPPIEDVATACRPRAVPTPVITSNADQDLARVVVTAAPESASVLVSRAWEYSKDGERDKTMALFDLALQRPDNDTSRERIEWSYGWAMFNLHDHRCALAHFAAARRTAPDWTGWVPYTYAVTYWQLGQRDAAVQWYDVAARNEPGCWIDAKAAGRCSRHWRPQERRALGELLAQWKAYRLRVSAAD